MHSIEDPRLHHCACPSVTRLSGRMQMDGSEVTFDFKAKEYMEATSSLHPTLE